MSLHSNPNQDLRRVAILFAGGPAPAANAVISTAAVSFLNHGIGVIGIRHGYSSLASYDGSQPLQVDRDYIVIDHSSLKRTRNSRGILIGTARTNPGKHIAHPSDLNDPQKAQPLANVYEGLCSLEVDALISIGGDDTLKTANKFKLFQERLPDNAHRIPVVHLPKTIDNDYFGIDFTFGFFTAVEFLAEELRNLIYDAEAGRSYFLAETMGRSAGWLAYGAAIAGEASCVLSVEDISGDFRAEESVEDPSTGEQIVRPVMNMDRIINHVVRVMEVREADGKEFGVIVMAEGLAEYLPMSYLAGVKRDDHGHIAISDINIGQLMAGLIADAYQKKTGKTRKVNGVQLGYESRCAQPHAFDVMLGSQLGVGAYQALAEKKLNGVMVSVAGQLDLHFEPFSNLVDPQTLVTKVRFIERDSDFYRLAKFLETYVNE